MWDLSTALELHDKSVDKMNQSGISIDELVKLLDPCDLSNSRCTTPSISPSPSVMVSNSYTPQTRRKVAMEQVVRTLEQYSTPGSSGGGGNGGQREGQRSNPAPAPERSSRV